jgi:hypothetical protein
MMARTLTEDDPVGFYLLEENGVKRIHWWNQHKFLAVRCGHVDYFPGEDAVVISGPLLTREEWERQSDKTDTADQAELVHLRGIELDHKMLLADHNALQARYDALFAAAKRSVDAVKADGCDYESFMNGMPNDPFRNLWALVYPEEAVPKFTAPPKPEQKLWMGLSNKESFWGVERPPGFGGEIVASNGWVWRRNEVEEIDPATGHPLSIPAERGE